MRYDEDRNRYLEDKAWYNEELKILDFRGQKINWRQVDIMATSIDKDEDIIVFDLTTHEDDLADFFRRTGHWTDSEGNHVDAAEQIGRL